MRSLNKLTASQVKHAAKSVGDGGGLWLTVKAGGRKSWTYRYRLHGKDREMGLGSLAEVSLAEARRLRGKYAELKRLGLDPISSREKERLQARLDAARSKSFDDCAREYIEARRPEWKNGKHAQQWQNTLETYASPIIGKLPVSEVDQDAVLRVLTPIWESKTETASRVRQRIEKILDWAKAMRFREGENPARWQGLLDQILPAPTRMRKPQHFNALPHTELQVFMSELRDQVGLSARALEFTILTACRTSEVIQAKWEEIDLQAKLWSIPASRMKAGKAHIVPLSSQTVSLLQGLPVIEGSDYLFPGARPGKPLSNMAMLVLLQKRMNRPGLTVHGFRSSFRDWGGEQPYINQRAVETALAHQLKDKTEASYFRSNMLEQRRELMQRWADYCMSAKSEPRVVHIRPRR